MSITGNGNLSGEPPKYTTRAAAVADTRDPSVAAVAAANLLGDPLLAFRTTWLRAVALAWGDPAFAARLMYNAVDALRERLSFEWPWPGSIKLTVRSETSFVWVGDDWVWPTDELRGEGVILYVPLTPPTEDPRKHVRALADYYQSHPALLAADPRQIANAILSSSAFSVNRQVTVALSERSRRDAPFMFAGTAPPVNGFVPNPTSLAEFQVVLLSIMAKAWANKNYRDLIQQASNVSTALETIRGYRAPWRLNLVIRDDNDARWDEGSGLWRTTTPHDLLLHLPAAPVEANDQSIALAAYNGTGSQFPFSCCA